MTKSKASSNGTKEQNGRPKNNRKRKRNDVLREGEITYNSFTQFKKDLVSHCLEGGRVPLTSGAMVSVASCIWKKHLTRRQRDYYKSEIYKIKGVEEVEREKKIPNNNGEFMFHVNISSID